MRLYLRKGDTFVIPGQGLATVEERYVGVPYGVDEAQMLLDVFVAGRGLVRSFPEAVAVKNGRPLMSRSEARQVLAIVANRLAPVPNVVPRVRLRRAKKAAAERDPVTMAKALRELIVRSEGRAGAPVKIPAAESAVRAQLVRLLCEEMTVVLDDGKGAPAFDVPCEKTLVGMGRRMNPNPAAADVAEYVSIYRLFNNDRISAEFKSLEREVKRARTIEHPEKRTEIMARHLALMKVLESRAPRRST